MAEFFEMIMVVCFGVSWPMSILKSYRSRSTNGKSLTFLCMIEVGYVAGILAKLVNISSKPLTYVFIFYVLNFIMVGLDIALYFRNKALENKAGAKANA